MCFLFLFFYILRPKSDARKIQRKMKKAINPSFQSTRNLLAPRDDFYMPKVRTYLRVFF